MPTTLRVEVYRATVSPYRWFWRLIWGNGRVAATSNGVLQKEVAVQQAQKIADAIGVDVEVIQPCVI